MWLLQVVSALFLLVFCLTFIFIYTLKTWISVCVCFFFIVLLLLWVIHIQYISERQTVSVWTWCCVGYFTLLAICLYVSACLHHLASTCLTSLANTSLDLCTSLFAPRPPHTTTFLHLLSMCFLHRLLLWCSENDANITQKTSCLGFSVKKTMLISRSGCILWHFNLP